MLSLNIIFSLSPFVFSFLFIGFCRQRYAFSFYLQIIHSQKYENHRDKSTDLTHRQGCFSLDNRWETTDNKKLKTRKIEYSCKSKKDKEKFTENKTKIQENDSWFQEIETKIQKIVSWFRQKGYLRRFNVMKLRFENVGNSKFTILFWQKVFCLPFGISV